MAALEAAVIGFFCGHPAAVGEEVVLCERRHREALSEAQLLLKSLLQGQISGAPLECLAMELREALTALGRITGETTTDDILEQIFSRFCIGK
jgi:tRNA modification GTPase